MNDWELDQRRQRWRLILGSSAESMLGRLGAEWSDREAALSFLYDREFQGQNIRTHQPSEGQNRRTQPSNGGQDGRNQSTDDRTGSLDPSNLTVPDWINAIHELFPQKTIERLEKDALERYHLQEMVTNPEVISRVQPSLTLLKAVLRTKHLMNPAVLAMAKDLVRKVVEQLREKLARPIQSPFYGSIHRQQRSYFKIAKNFDASTTIRRNLKHYDRDRQQLVIQTPYFHSRIRRQVDRWQLIILVDESGSMLDSVIHSAITAAIFWEIKALKTHLCLFDTSVVDVTADCVDPVETLMKVQLGGGTDIGQAMAYAQTLIDNPRRSIVILISDFYEGAPIDRLFRTTQQLIESGVTVLGLAALDGQANPCYDRNIAQRLVSLGAEVAALTPGELAVWVAEKVR